MQARQLVREAVRQLGAQHLGEQRVIADTRRPSSRARRRSPPLGSSSWSACRPSATPVSASASSPFTPLHDRGPEQEPERLLVVAAQDLRASGSRSRRGRRPAKPAMNPLGSGLPCERQLRQPEPPQPIPRCAPERLHVRLRESERAEQLARLGSREREVRGADLGQPAGHPQALEPERRVAAGGEHQTQSRRRARAASRAPRRPPASRRRGSRRARAGAARRGLERVEHARAVPRSLVGGREAGDRRGARRARTPAARPARGRARGARRRRRSRRQPATPRAAPTCRSPPEQRSA